MILAEELKKRGHTVWLGVHKHSQDIVKATGIDTVEIGGDLEHFLSITSEGIELRRNPSILKMGLVKRTFQPMIEEWFNGILSGIKDADLIVLTVASIFLGLSCIEKFPNTKAIGIYTFPVTRTAHFSPPGLGGKSDSLFNWTNLLKWKIVDFTMSNIYNDKLNELRATKDLPSMKLNYDRMTRSLFRKPMISATIYSKYFLPRPSDWHENDHMVGPIPEEGNQNFEPPTPILDFLTKWKNEKIIYVGLGSMMGTMFEADEKMEFIRKILLALDRNNCKAVISLVGFENNDISKLSTTDNILYLTHDIPHCWLFLHMSATIHHGGAGTTHASLRYGLPTLVLSFGADQPFNGDRIFINRLGPRSIPIRQTNVKNLANAIRDVMIDNYNIIFIKPVLKRLAN
ncbi:unnamed protein product [Rotaria sordida]|uniref:Erythromycin biosynthesis protein CIII-like C-terminal domain-containing protein n=1 Tax=Rotaria sordida TaxID=392033 RepID=A0A819QBZ8_9BILA|nr:unnamed protein product [Rotaria sordida]